MANPLVFLLHDGRPLPQARGELVEVDYEVVRELPRFLASGGFRRTHRGGDVPRPGARGGRVAEVRVLAAMEHGRPIGFAQVETHDGGSEVSQVFVHSARRGAGVGGRAHRGGDQAGRRCCARCVDLRRPGWSPTPALRTPRLPHGGRDGRGNPAAEYVIRQRSPRLGRSNSAPARIARWAKRSSAVVVGRSAGLGQ